MSYPWRCCNKKCRKYKYLKWQQHKEALAHGQKCKCGYSIYLDKARLQARKREKCKCDAYWWDGPHRKGSSVWCEAHPTGPTDEDWKERYGR